MKKAFKTKEIEFGGFKGYEVWDKLPNEDKVKRQHKGSQVWVAGEPKTKWRIIKDIHSKGKKGWREGGVTIIEMETGIERFYTKEKVRLHPKPLLK
jgi:hypothetical protein